MAYIPKIQHLQTTFDIDKENHRQNRIQINISRHCRVQSTLALNVRKQDKSQTSQISTSIHNISSNILNDFAQQRPQRISNGDLDAYDILQHPTNRSKIEAEIQRNSNSLQYRHPPEPLQPCHNRIRTDHNISFPLRNPGSQRPLSFVNHPANISNIILSKTPSNISPINQRPPLFRQSPVVPPNNPQVVGEYTFQILKHLQGLPDLRTFNAFTFQTEVTERMRSILLDWVIDVHMKFRLQPETLFLTVFLVDVAIERIQLQKTKLQLIGISALFMASKYEEVYATPHVRDLTYVCDNAFSKQEILKAESLILQSCNFDILHVSSWRLLGIYNVLFQYDQKNFLLARYLIELALIEYKTGKNSANVVACAAIYLVNKIRRIVPSWDEEHVKITYLSESDIRPCAKELCTLLQNCDRKCFISVKKKYSLPIYMEVSKIRIEKKTQ